MKYRDILKERERYKSLVDNLKLERDLKETNFYINDEIKKNKFKYKFYNQLLKGDRK